jgi:RNA polymerase sigma-70 factor, ECF subfamily
MPEYAAHVMGPIDKKPTSFEDLLRRARSGEKNALEELFQRALPTLRRAASRRAAGSRAASAGAGASDVVQEALEQALRKLDTFKGASEAEWYAWLARILGRRAVQSVRDARRKKRAIPGGLPLDTPEAAAAPSPFTSPSREASRRQEWHILLGCLHELPENQREAIRLHHLEGLSLDDAAAHMGKKPLAVKGLVGRGIKSIQARVAEPDERSLLERLRALRPRR